MNELEQWIEDFYSDLEKGLDNYTRPKDYKERAMRVLKGKRTPVLNQKEGQTKSFNLD